MIPTLKSIFNFNQWKQVQQWVNNKLTLKQDIFNPNNTASGEFNVTLNAKSGIVTFTGEVVQNDNPIYFTISNNLVTSNTKLFYSMYYSPNDTEVLFLLNYICSSGQISFQMFCLDGFGSAQQEKIISFQILN